MKIGIIQIGLPEMVGPLALEKIATNGLANVVVLISRFEDFAAQQASDIQKSLGDVASVMGGTDLKLLLNGAEVVIITGSLQRRPGTVREDLPRINRHAFLDISVEIRNVVPQAYVIVAPFNITDPETLKEIVAAVKSRLKQVTQILPPDNHGEYETEGPFKLSARILSEVDGFVTSD